jgi:uncharacterized membrane protein (UPF0127 family)
LYMDFRYKRLFIFLACILVILNVLPIVFTLPVPTGEYKTTTLDVTNCSGSVESTFTVDIAETPAQKYVGLSRHETLDSGTGMLFTFNETKERSLVMRNMDFSLAIVFINEEHVVTDVLTVDKPSWPIEYYVTYERVTGNGMYILEIPKKDSKKVPVDSCVEWD